MEPTNKPDAPLTAADIQRAIEAANEKRSNSNWRFVLYILAMLLTPVFAYVLIAIFGIVKSGF